jgi:hypothetical protein
VAIDGDTVVVTARFADGDDGSYSVGKAHVYRRDPSGADLWAYVATLSPSMPSSGGYFGSALGLAGDTVLIGAPGTTIDARARQGAAYLFERAAGGPDAWGEVARLLAFDGLSEGQFGSAVALDGAAKIIGAKGDSTYRGAVYLHAPAPPDEPDEPDEPATPAYPATGELVNDSVIEHPSGAVLGAVENAVLDALPVWIHEVQAPAEPLFAGAMPVGAYYNIGAVRTTSLPIDTPFAVGLPVPATANPSRLGLAGLVASEHVLDGTSTGLVWVPVTGFHDTESGLYVVDLGALAIEGHTIVLIEHPDLAAAHRQDSASAQRLVGTSFNFEVTCYLTNCTETLQRTLDQLERAHAEYSKSFPEPHLKRKQWHYCREQMIYCYLGDAGRYKGISLYKESAMPSPLCDYAPAATTGYPFIPSINFCIEVEGHALDYFDATVSHELFHAYQYGLDPVWWQYVKHQMQYWIIEATAEAAGGSLTSLITPPASSVIRDWTNSLVSVRRIDLSFTVPNDPQDSYNYEAQDFWVYLAELRQLSLGYLKYMLEQGATAADVDGQITLHFNSSLADEYWGWVKNQLMLEDDINFHPGGPPPTLPPLDQPPCQIQPKVVKHDPNNLALMLDHTISIAQPSQHAVAVPLLPLQSNVVEITFAAGTTIGVRISATGAGLRHKVYLDQPVDVDGAACRNVADGDRTIGPGLPPGAKAYVLVSNTTHVGSAPITYEVRVDALD